MSDITSDVQETIDEIFRLADDGSVGSLNSACKDYLAKKIFPGGELKPGISTSVIPLVLPTILKCFDYDDPLLQQDGAFFIDAIASTPDEKQHAKLVIEAGVIPLLINNLSPSTEDYVLDQSLACLGKIAVYYPCVIIENGILQPLHECLKSKNRRVYFQGVKCLAILSTNCQENVYDFLVDKVQTTKALVKLVQLHGRNGGAENHDSLANLLSPDFNDGGALESLKAVFNWLLAEKPKIKKNEALRKPEERKILKLLAFKLIKNAISLFGKAAVDIIDRELFFQPIVKHIFGAVATPDIKIEAIKVIEKSVAAKPDFLLTLINDYDIISLLSKNLLNKTKDLLEIAVRTLKNAIEKCNDACRRKINDFGGLGVLEKLVEHNKKEISEPSKIIYGFVNVEPVDGRDGEDDEIEQDMNDGDSRIASDERPQTRHQSRQGLKRAATPFPDERPFIRSRTANETVGNERSHNFMNDGIDDHPGNSSSLILDTVAASNRNTSSGRQSFATSTDNGIVRNGFNVGHQSVHGDDVNQLTGPSSSHAPISVPEIVSINDILTETKPRLQPPSSVIEMIIPAQITSTPQNSSQNALTGQNVAADGTHPNNLNPRNESSTSANLSRSSSRISSALLHPAATDHGTTSRLHNNTNRAKIESFSSDFGGPSPLMPSNSPGLPEGSATDERNQYNNHFAPFEYLYPGEAFIKKCCQQYFDITFNYRLRQKFLRFIEKINIQHVGIDSKPFVSHPTNDETGFGCISMLFTGTESYSDFIRKKINQKFAYYFSQSDNFDESKLIEVTGQPYTLKCEHLETICRWLECRVMVYYNEKWKLYGDWNSADNQNVFVLEKKTIKEKAIYQVVKSVETVLD